MSTHIKWTDRKFNFDFPSGLYPELIERLRGTPARAAEQFADTPAEILTARTDAGWSIQEHVGHLADLDVSLFLQRLDDFASGAETLSPADMTNQLTEQANHNARSFDEVLDTFRACRARVIERLEALEPQDFARTASHPRLGTPMRLVDMLYFHGEHDDFHIARAMDLVREFSNGVKP